MTAKTPQAHTASGYQGWYEPETVTYYHGHATIASPTARPPYTGWSESHVVCRHRHTDPRVAEKCGRNLGERTAKAMSKATAEAGRGPAV